MEPGDLSAGVALGGYTILEKLGAGGMGAVYLARQNSLDRNVALKTLHPRLADNPQLVARFTREAYAAAQLTHHNIVQIYDIGQEHGTNFFSMEFVHGQTLQSVLEKSHKLDVETGVGYVLQAARGLRFAHEHGLIHRDIKPENLLLNDQGMVKVADLGLVKRVGSSDITSKDGARSGDAGNDLAATQFNKSMGTPLYMPPEQAADAAHVDQRADVYSLGATLYHLITGRPPFTGRSAMELITQHANSPVVPPDAVVRDVPRNLSPLILRMLAKHPDDRFPNMGEVIESLEKFLGIATVGPYMPTSNQIHAIEFAAADFYKTPWTKLRPKVVLAFYVACVLLAVLLAYLYRDEPVKATNLVGGTIGLMIMTTLAYHITAGLRRRTAVFLKLRQVIFGASLKDWLMWLAGFGLFGIVIYAFGLWLPWLIAGIGGVVLALGFFSAFDVAGGKAQEPALREAENVIRALRARGVDEKAIRHAVCRFSGNHWEAFFEALFGYEDKLEARIAWGKDRGRDRPKFGAWREPVIAYLERRIEARKRLREAKLLAKIEAKAMRAAGLDEKAAEKKAAKEARRLVMAAEKSRAVSHRSATAVTIPPPAGRPVTAPPVSMARPLVIEHADDTVTDHDPHYEHLSDFRRRHGSLPQMIFGPFWRGAIGLVLLVIFAQWWTSTATPEVIQSGQQVLSAHREDPAEIAKRKNATVAEMESQESVRKLNSNKPLTIPLVPAKFTKGMAAQPFLYAGLLLLAGALCRGVLLGIVMYIAAAVALFGSSMNVPMMNGSPFVAAVAAAALWCVAVIFLRERN